MFVVTGIDPGKTGASCRLHFHSEQGRNTLTIYSILPNPIIAEKKTWEYDIQAMKGIIKGSDLVVIEQAIVMPKQGVVSSSRFKEGFGIWKGLAEGLGIRCKVIHAREWKKDIMGFTKKDKTASILRAKEIFPGINLKRTGKSKVDDSDFAESALIAYWGFLWFNKSGLI